MDSLNPIPSKLWKALSGDSASASTSKVSETDKRKKPALSSEKQKELYERLKRYLLKEGDLRRNDYPRPSGKPGMCSFASNPLSNVHSTRKQCWRCKKKFILESNGEFQKKSDTCVHRDGICATHVHRDNLNDCSGYLENLGPSTNDDLQNGVYAVDCEMCYTVEGLELIRVSVLDFSCNLIYDSLVKPNGRILDYNTKWSGVDAKDMEDVTTSLKDVQNEFLQRFSAETIFIGHSLESDLKALRIVHSTVIDTSVLFPHRRGFPYKRALRNLVKDHLGMIIQNSDKKGHDSSEDARACVKLMKWKLRRDTGYFT